MIGRPTVTVAFVVLVAFFVITTPVGAEWLSDLYAGAAITDHGTVDLTAAGEKLTAEDLQFKRSFVVGGRFGYWSSFFGVNLDINYFRPSPDADAARLSGLDPALGPVTTNIDADLDTIAIGVNAMLRGQFIKDSAVPAGRLQPYIFGGPTVFFSTLDLKGSVSALGTTVTFNGSDTSTELGFTAGAGVTYLFTHNIGLFAEYRFTRSRPEFQVLDLKIEPTLNTHHALAGVTFRF